MSPAKQQSPLPTVCGSWRLAALVAVILSLVISPAVLAGPAAQPEPPAWTQTSLTEPVLRLFTPSSGALFARTAAALQRSDDGGLTWRAVSLPAPPDADSDAVVIDPTSHQTIYVAAADGLYKTDDDAASWRLILPVEPATSVFASLAISPADPRIAYVLYTSQMTNVTRFQRSLDGGQTWETLPELEALPPGAIPQRCTWAVTIMQPHPAEADRLFVGASCNIRADQVRLRESRDGGRTVSTLLYEYPLGRVTTVVGGLPNAPRRLYLGVGKDYRGGGSLLMVSNDDGATWNTLLEYTGGGGMSGGGPDVTIGGLSVDPTNADRVLVGLNASKGAWATPPALRLSLDGGQNWLDATPDGIGRLADVAFGFDGRMLFAASASGVWRAPGP